MSSTTFYSGVKQGYYILWYAITKNGSAEREKKLHEEMHLEYLRSTFKKRPFFFL